MEDNDFGGLARDMERQRLRQGAAFKAEPKRYLVDPPGGWQNGTKREFDTMDEAQTYLKDCPARTGFVDRMPHLEHRPAAVEPANPPNPKQRYGDRKVNLSLVPSSSIIYEALALEDGAEKYDPYNWRVTGVEAMTYVSAFQRHMAAWINGEELDPKSGKPHLGHAKACLGILIDAKECGKLIDNRPPPAATGELLRKWQKPPVEDYAEDGSLADLAEEMFGPHPFGDHPSLGESDETTAAHIHHFRLTPGDPTILVCDCGAELVIRPEPSLGRKLPCHCRDMDRCRIENGRVVGNNEFCVKAEEGR